MQCNEAVQLENHISPTNMAPSSTSTNLQRSHKNKYPSKFNALRIVEMDAANQCLLIPLFSLLHVDSTIYMLATIYSYAIRSEFIIRINVPVFIGATRIVPSSNQSPFSP